MTAASTESGTATRPIHVGRQPVYDRVGDVVGYELLFRGNADALTATSRNAFATSQVIVTAFTEFGLDQLVGDRPCFVNLTREFLVGELPVPFDYGQTVLEVLESVPIDDEVVAGVERLIDSGYTIALDDFEWSAQSARLMPMATYVKIDMLETDAAEIASTVKRCREYPNIELVAERLETEERLGLAFELGFDLFQGHILGRPHVISSRGLSPSRLKRLELLTTLTSDDADIKDVVEIVTADAALSFRVLRATNNAASGMTNRVSSIQQAVVLLGMRRIREWVALMLISDVCEASEDQLSNTMIRARLCQTVAEHLGLSGASGFTVGLLSGVAELVGEPLAEIADRLPLTEEVALALQTGGGRLGEVLQTVRAYERVDLHTLGRASIDSMELATAYLAALGWSARTFADLGEPGRQN
ncbi:EAL and HDOD domain-containing protein [Virgisporangium aliadipatigenens]|uniref:EAL and HDOD domain-containing protein n=1 Tax=Virgisporangium aliadipatigenens TaxID=741659 RepID=UPI0019405006|nr:HDOD domain-containing protein [Virgisporangium aliadipatigenens]